MCCFTENALGALSKISVPTFKIPVRLSHPHQGAWTGVTPQAPEPPLLLLQTLKSISDESSNWASKHLHGKPELQVFAGHIPSDCRHLSRITADKISVSLSISGKHFPKF